jgi:hypothetical protein
MHLIQTKLLNPGHKHPLKHTSHKTKLVIDGSVAHFKTPLGIHLISYVLRIATLAFWGFTIYNAFTFNFLLFGNIPFLATLILTPLFYIGGLILTFLSWALKHELKTASYIDKDSGKICLPAPQDEEDENKYECKDISVVQVLTYSQTRSSGTPGVKINVKLFEINLIMKNNTRLPVCTLQRNKKKAILLADRLSTFLEKPLRIEENNSN